MQLYAVIDTGDKIDIDDYVADRVQTLKDMWATFGLGTVNREYTMTSYHDFFWVNEEGKFEIQYSYKTRDYYRHVAYATIPEDKIIYPE